MEQVLDLRTSHIRIVLEDIFQPHNASAVMRSCECFGIQHLHVIENRYTYTLNREVAMGSSKWIQLHRYNTAEADNTRSCLDDLRSRGYRIAATCLGGDSLPLGEVPVDKPLSLWFGTEEEGLSETVLNEADLRVHIPMFGFTQSFNISVSAAICLHDLRQRLAGTRLDWRLDADERRAVLLHWLRNTVRRADAHERAFLSKGASGPASTA